MRTTLTKLKSLIVIGFVTSLVLMSSCKKEEDPAYVGTWAALGTISLDSAGTNVVDAKDLLILSKSSFTELIQMKNPNTNQWISMAGIKGNLTVSGTMMSLYVKSAGLSTQDGFTGLPTGNITYYQEGTSSFDDLLYSLGISQSFSGTYSIEGNSLIFNQTSYTKQ